MELTTLNESFQPDLVVENYSSLIWTERYSTNGDFELTTRDIANTMNLLPLESYICLRESAVPMVVEVHKIEKDKNGVAALTVSGRSFETVLERRGSTRLVWGPYSGVPVWTKAAAKESDAAFMALRQTIGDADQYLAGSLVLPQVNPGMSTDDAIPEVKLVLPADYSVLSWDASIMYERSDVVSIASGVWEYTDPTPSYGDNPDGPSGKWTQLSATPLPAVPPTRSYEIRPQNLYKTITDLISVNYHGIKATRPLPGATQVEIEIYNGADLTGEFQFNARFDQFNKATYLLSKRGSANSAYVFGPNGLDFVQNAAATGLDRRVVIIDISGDASAEDPVVRSSRGLIELSKNHPTALFGGEISTQVASGYNSDYFLGDIIKLVGEYGLYENVRVAEFIRTSDSTGEKAYPTFEVVV